MIVETMDKIEKMIQTMIMTKIKLKIWKNVVNVNVVYEGQDYHEAVN